MTTARCCGHEPSERLSFDPLDAIQAMEGVASGRINEATLADWFRAGIWRLSRDRINTGAKEATGCPHHRYEILGLG